MNGRTRNGRIRKRMHEQWMHEQWMHEQWTHAEWTHAVRPYDRGGVFGGCCQLFLLIRFTTTFTIISFSSVLG